MLGKWLGIETLIYVGACSCGSHKNMPRVLLQHKVYALLQTNFLYHFLKKIRNASKELNAVKVDWIYIRSDSSLLLWSKAICEVELQKQFSKFLKLSDTLCFQTSNFLSRFASNFT